MNQAANSALDGTVQAPGAGWAPADIPETPGTALQYRTRNGDRVIAVLADSCMWRIQSISTHGSVHAWSWTPAALAGNLGGVDCYTIIPAP